MRRSLISSHNWHLMRLEYQRIIKSLFITHIDLYNVTLLKKKSQFMFTYKI